MWRDRLLFAVLVWNGVTSIIGSGAIGFMIGTWLRHHLVIH